MQAAWTRLPEFDSLRLQSKARPVRRASDVASIELFLVVGNTLCEILGVLDRLALNRSPGADLTFARAGGEVSVGLIIGNNLDRTLGADLHLERRPMEADGSNRVSAKLASLATLEIRVENKASLVDIFH